MTSFRSNKVIKITSFIIAGFIMMMVLNRSVFFHTHTCANGWKISHSHPYQKTDTDGTTKSHEHTKAALVLISCLESALFILTFHIILAVTFSSSNLTFIDTPRFRLPGFTGEKYARPPPHCVID